MGDISYPAVSNQYKIGEQQIIKKEGCYSDFVGIVKELKLQVKI